MNITYNQQDSECVVLVFEWKGMKLTPVYLPLQWSKTPDLKGSHSQIFFAKHDEIEEIAVDLDFFHSQIQYTSQ
jgi:hypothetical protein